MTSGLRIPKAEISGAYGDQVKQISRAMFGEVPESVEVMGHNPDVFAVVFGLMRGTDGWDACDEGLKSLADMAASALVGCSFCMDLGYFMAHHRDVDETKVREVPRWRESDVFTPLERDVMAYAEAMCQTPPTVSDELFARLLDALGPAAMLELTAVVAIANVPARLNLALGITSQGFSKVCELPLAEPSPGRVAASG
ncbi:MAG TPA: carboxymuconolactone decarboxylase family protein [Acidimicrobiales bacterium]